jgi:hypothetical protein
MANHGSVSLKSAAQATLIRAVVDVTSDISGDDLRGAGGLRLLVERLGDRLIPSTDPLAKARLRGVIAMRELLRGEGGSLTAKEVAERLGISRQAVDKRRKAGQLLALEPPKRGLHYPAWQFVDGGTLPGLAPVLDALRDHDAWAQARFFVSGNRRLGGLRPIDLLRQRHLASLENLERVLGAARMMGVHGAA